MSTTISLAYLRRSRELFLEMMEDLSLEELNLIPEGFNNNIIWNLGHILVSTLGLCYIRSQVKPDLALPFAGRFGKGTRPEVAATAEEVATIKRLVATSLEEIEKDIEAGTFVGMKPSSTDTYQIQMDCIDNTLICCLAHENLHLGIARTQKTLLRQAKKAAKENTVSLN